MTPSSAPRRFINAIWCMGFAIFTIASALAVEVKESLPFCGLVGSPNRYILVSTLDGKLTALNPDNEGSVVWSVHLGTESMLSSSIHKLELTNYGQLVRMIPSLSGGLYRFNGESLEAIPITVEHLLQASFKFSDDLVISGGKESQTYGVSLQSGKILYECSMKGCENASKTQNVGDILVIQRLGQTVRAVEPRTGFEKWNFSVAQHDLMLLSECHEQQQHEQNYRLKVFVPNGLICAVDSKDKNVIWKHRFDSPIVSAWQVRKGKLYSLDLFSDFQPPNLDMVVTPSLYIGMHEKQLYIQESVLMQRRRQEISAKVGQNLIAYDNDELSISWKAVLANRNVRGLIEGKVGESSDQVDERQTTALSVLYASPYVEGNGFYLYSEDEKKNSLSVVPEEKGEAGAEEEEEEEDTPVQIVIVSLWYWWKEVAVISLTTAILFNLMFTRRFLTRRSRLADDASSDSSAKLKVSDSGIDVNIEKGSGVADSAGSSQEFVSRYLTDFEPVNCLGKGGFGVVFEAKNKIDDCHYAIKRIVLPISQESRDRVLREVKALAKLDHHHIVRYFNAWTECPPPGWQDARDKVWLDCSLDTSSGMEPYSTRRNGTPSSSANSSPRGNSRGFEDRTLDESEDLNLGNDGNDSFIIFDEAFESGDKAPAESVVTFNTDSDEANKDDTSAGVKVKRPDSLKLSERTCALSCNPNRIYLYIQMQLCKKQSLRDWLTLNTEREYGHVLRIFEQILQAVEHVHLQNLIHRDLKPSNIFFSLDNEIKIGDFGLVTAMTEGEMQMSPCDCSKVTTDKRHTAQVGTQLYMSPEQLSGKPYNYKVDIYSLGLILFELLVPFNTQMERVHVLENIKNDRFSDDFINKYKREYELLRLMLSRSPDERPTTYGIRARLPLKQDSNEQSWHFNLPKRRRGSSKTSSTSTSSSDGTPEYY